MKKPYVGEVEDRMGVFTIGKVKNVYEAHELFLDWYYDYMKDANSRMYFEDYWSVSPETLSVENIQETTAMVCRKCGLYSLDDSECFQCEDQRLDHRTKFKTFYVPFI